MKARALIIAPLLLWPGLAGAQGVIPLALAQQSDLNGRPMSGALLYIYQVGTTATPQNAFQDFGLTMPFPWPVRADQLGRIPMFYLANGQVHVRLTDAQGVVQFDIPNMQVVGPSSGGGGGGGGTVDPAAIFSPGDFKWRPDGQLLPGWVKANGQSIGSAMCSGCTGRQNADTQNLYVYLWTNCQTHCPVVGGRGATALADFNALKPLTLPDMRGRSPFGLDDMGAAAAGRIAPSNITSGGGDGVTTPAATGGEANHLLVAAELATHGHPITDVGHAHGFTYQQTSNNPGGGVAGVVARINPAGENTSVVTQNTFTGITTTQSGCAPACSGTAHNTMPPFILGSWHIKL
jgi:hypothetical protein